ncbi:hypothetical protein [Agrobacterium vitis]|uniref:Uncharacterized protein n=1 Tax=Agrobacterium vitis TaxID=373 RepID=A0AAE2R837_AGRVI|nr:hypothetical protein [Agrobacterium vitis]MBF2713361.1 hypothetical protein [Agrobacterium vitis]
MLKIDDAIGLIIDGTHEANRKYLRMSGGATVHEYGIEPLISATIAETLYNSGAQRGEECFVTLETTCWELVKWSLGGEVEDSVYKDSDGQRGDVVYWNRHNLPEGVVEVKRHFSFSNCEDDIRKISSLLSRLDTQEEGTLKWGAVASMRETTNTSTKDKKAVLKDFLSKCEEKFPDFTFKGRCEEVEVEADSAVKKRRPELTAFQAYAVLFRRKKE